MRLRLKLKPGEIELAFFAYREEEKSYSSIDRKYTIKQDLPSNFTVSQTNHNRTTTLASQWVEPDSNPNAPGSSPSSSQDKGCTGSVIQERDIELEAASHLLTKQEKSLCIQLDLKPTQYLTQKTLLLQVRGDRQIQVFSYSIVHYLLILILIL